MIDRILETILYCRDMDGARRFYTETLGLRQVSDNRPRGMGFRISPNAVLLIFNPDLTPLPNPMVPSHGAIGPGHIGLGVAPNTLDEWRVRLADAGVPIEQEASWPNGARSIYFRDQDGNSVELIEGDLWPR